MHLTFSSLLFSILNKVPDTELSPFFGTPTAPSYLTTTLDDYIEDTAPHDLFCPVGHCLMYEAMVSKGDGELYERENLELHIAFAQINDRELYSPLTNMPMEAVFVPCNFMRRAVREHVGAAIRKWENSRTGSGLKRSCRILQMRRKRVTSIVGRALTAIKYCATFFSAASKPRTAKLNSFSFSRSY